MMADDSYIASVIICHKDMPNDLKELLKCLSKIGNPHRSFEIVIVDDKSSEQNQRLIKSIIDENKHLPVKFIKSPKKLHPAGARNLGVQFASGKFLIFLDSDSLVNKKWLRNIISLLDKRTDVSAATGPCKPISYAGVVGRCRKQAVEKYYAPIRRGPISSGRHSCGSNLTIRKEVFQAIGGFDEKFKRKEDHEIVQRMLELDYNVYYDPKIYVYHKEKNSLLELFRKQFSYASFVFSLVLAHHDLIKEYGMMMFFSFFMFFLWPIMLAFWFIFSLPGAQILLLLPFSYIPLFYYTRRTLFRAIAISDKLLFPVINLVFNVGWSAGFTFGFFRDIFSLGKRKCFKEAPFVESWF